MMLHEGATVVCGECTDLRREAEVRRRHRLRQDTLTAIAYALAAAALVWFGAWVQSMSR